MTLEKMASKDYRHVNKSSEGELTTLSRLVNMKIFAALISLTAGMNYRRAQTVVSVNKDVQHHQVDKFHYTHHKTAVLSGKA